MKSFPFLLFFSFLLSLLFLGVSACHPPQRKEHVLRVGVMAGREEELLEEAAKVARDQYGIDVESVTFSDYAMPNTALEEGSIDLNIFQHQPYLEAQNQSRGYHLIPIAKTFLFPLAAYSHKVRHLEELPRHAQVAIPNDPTNLGRALLLLQQGGLIKLQSGKGTEATTQDIIENPKELQFIELDAAQLPRSLDDVDLGVITTTYAAEANLLPRRDGILVENKTSPYVNVIVEKEVDGGGEKQEGIEKKKEEDITNFIKAYHAPEVVEKANQLFEGNAIKGW